MFDLTIFVILRYVHSNGSNILRRLSIESVESGRIDLSLRRSPDFFYNIS
jgi:hypothetical protein